MSNSVRTTSGGVAPNAKRLLWAGFMAILAAGIGFGIRGGILANWAAEFGFTGAQLGAIGGAGFTGFCFGIIIGGVVVDKIGYGKLVVAAFLFHVLSAFVTFARHQGTGAGHGLHVPVHRHVPVRAGQRHARSGRQPARLDALPAQPHALPEHPSCELAGRPGPRRPRRLDPRRRHACELEAAARAVPRADGALRRRVPRPDVPEVGGSAKGLSLGEMLQEVGILGALVACFLVGLFFKDQLGGILAFFTGSPFFTSAAWSYLAWGVALRPCCSSSASRRISRSDRCCCSCCSSRTRCRRGRARHRRLDSEHHRQHPDAGARARSCSSSPRC